MLYEKGDFVLSMLELLAYPEIKILTFSRKVCSGSNDHRNNLYFALSLVKAAHALHAAMCPNAVLSHSFNKTSHGRLT